MKNKEFFYLQYNKINWENQEKTKINAKVYDYIIRNILLKHKRKSIKVFDIGFGIGFFLRLLQQRLPKKFSEVGIAGCEPSEKNYARFLIKPNRLGKTPLIQAYPEPFKFLKTTEKFDFITAIYVFTHFTSGELDRIVKKIHAMLNRSGKFVLVAANEKYLEEKLRKKKDLFIEKNFIEFRGQKYKELLYYSDIPQIGKVIDYDREERFYHDLFSQNRFKLVQKGTLNDSGFICTMLVFEKR